MFTVERFFKDHSFLEPSEKHWQFVLYSSENMNGDVESATSFSLYYAVAASVIIKIFPDQRIDAYDLNIFITSRSQAWDAPAGVTQASFKHGMKVWQPIESIEPGKWVIMALSPHTVTMSEEAWRSGRTQKQYFKTIRTERIKTCEGPLLGKINRVDRKQRVP